MANKRFLMGMLVTVLVFGMAVVGCDNGSDDGSTGNGGTSKSITITGITGKTGEAMISVASSLETPVAVGMGSISGGSVTFSLINEYNTPFTGSGSYYLALGFNEQETYLYTNGKTLVELGITGEADFAKLPKYTISSATSTIAFTQFTAMN